MRVSTLFYLFFITTSCTTIVQSSDSNVLYGPISVRDLQVIVENDSDVMINADRFFNEKIFKKSDDGIRLSVIYLDCAPIYNETKINKIYKSLVHTFSFGFIPRKLKYNCPVEMVIVRNSKENKFRYVMEIVAISSSSEIFRSGAPLIEQLNGERFRQSKTIFENNYHKMFDQGK